MAERTEMTERERSVANALSDMATLVERGALSVPTTITWLRNLAAFLHGSESPDPKCKLQEQPHV
jgi:hypothetical protein